MSEQTYYPTTEELIAGQKNRKAMLFYAMVAVVVVIFGTMGAVGYLAPTTSGPTVAAIGLGIFVCLLIPFVIWNQPRAGIYLLFFSSVVPNVAPWMGDPSLSLSFVPMWYNVSIIGQMHGTRALDAVYISPGEIIFLLTICSWLVRTAVDRHARIRGGAFLPFILPYIVMIGFGWIHGISSGGDTTAALREVRAQMHFFAIYLLATNLLTEWKHIRPIIWMATILIGIQGGIGLVTYLTMTEPVGLEGLPGLSHTNSLMFNLLFFIYILCIITKIDGRLTWVSGLLVPATLMADFANQRRAGIASFIIAFVPLLPMLWVLFKERRAQVKRFGIIFGFIAAIYMPLAWNASGPWALPARAIRSNTDPNYRDAASNYYRMAEDADLKFSRDLEPWTGTGYGKPFAQIIPLPMVTTDLLYITPHNGVLWVWMRLGHFGFFAFLMMFAGVFIRGSQILKECDDPRFRFVGVLAILHFLMLFTYGKYDLQLINSEQMVAVGMLLGILANYVYRQKPAPEGEAPEAKAVVTARAAG